MGSGLSGGENQRKGEEFAMFLWSALTRVLKKIQGGEKNFSSLTEVKEKMRRREIQQEEERMNNCLNKG